MEEKISKLLSYVLRHKPESIGISLDKEGWTDIDVLISKCAPRLEFTREDLARVVENNDKQRFAISDDGQKIRANQGHTADVNLSFEKKTPPDMLYHGTQKSFLGSIQKKGLLPGKRHHVHMSDNLVTAEQVGARRGANSYVILTIDCKEMVKDGVEFFLSENGVWLTDKVESKYINFPL
jgi:putative RNA 2'-phosphotransferase